MGTKQFGKKIIFVGNKILGMKKYIFSFIFILVSAMGFNTLAQQGYHIERKISATDILKPSSNSRLFYDTLKPASQDTLGLGFCGDTALIVKLNSPAQGYIGGNNSNGDKEILQKFGVSIGGGVYTILALCGKKTNTSNSLMKAKMYAVDPITHGPGAFIYETDPIGFADVDTSYLHFFFSTFPFPGVIQVFGNDSFFASIELPTGTGDTLAVWMTPQNCYSGNQQAYVMKSDGTFLPLNGGTGTYGLNSDFWIWPVFIPDSSAGNSAISLRDLSLFRAFPNPGSNSITVNFSNNNPSVVWVDFVDDLGRMVSTVGLGFQLSGKHSINVDVSHLPAANYYYSIATPNERLFSRICVIH